MGANYFRLRVGAWKTRASASLSIGEEDTKGNTP